MTNLTKPQILTDEQRMAIWTCKEGTLEAICKAQRDDTFRETNKQHKIMFQRVVAYFRWITKTRKLTFEEADILQYFEEALNQLAGEK